MIISSTSPVQIHEQLSLARLSKDFKCQLQMLKKHFDTSVFIIMAIVQLHLEA